MENVDMNLPKFLVVKFVPDILRNEPRNVGVLLWSPHGTKAKFIAEKENGNIDGRSIPQFVTSPEAYRQWVTFFHNELSRETIFPYRGGAPVHRSSPKFLDTLRDAASANFVLDEGGVLVEQLQLGIEPADLDQMADYLFCSLVLDGDGFTVDQKDSALQRVSEKVLVQSRIKSAPTFKQDLELDVEVGKVRKTKDKLKFSFGFRNGNLSLFQKVSFRNPGWFDKNVHSAAWKFQQVLNNELTDENHTFALVYATPEQLQDEQVDTAISILSSVGKVFNLHEQEDELLDKLLHLQSQH